jgi:hypothetical protein
MLAASSDSGGGGAATLAILFLVALYFIPTIVAVIRKVPNLGSVIVVNLFLGWSLIGWVVALAMAARSVPAQNHVVVNQYTAQSPPPPPPPG